MSKELDQVVAESKQLEVAIQVLKTLSPELKQQLGAYIEAEHLPAEHLNRTDVALALLRINTPPSLKAAEKLMGITIKKLPPSVPPWPPLPVTPSKVPPKVVQIRHSGHFTQTVAAERFRWVKLGMTIEQLVQRGINRRDIRTWKRQGRIVFA